jgi:hypothetical protein
MGKPPIVTGLGWGAGPVSLGLTALIVCLVAYLGVTRRYGPTKPAAEARS